MSHTCVVHSVKAESGLVAQVCNLRGLRYYNRKMANLSLDWNTKQVRGQGTGPTQTPGDVEMGPVEST